MMSIVRASVKHNTMREYDMITKSDIQEMPIYQLWSGAQFNDPGEPWEIQRTKDGWYITLGSGKRSMSELFYDSDMAHGALYSVASLDKYKICVCCRGDGFVEEEGRHLFTDQKVVLTRTCLKCNGDGVVGWN